MTSIVIIVMLINSSVSSSIGTSCVNMIIHIISISVITYMNDYDNEHINHTV